MSKITAELRPPPEVLTSAELRELLRAVKNAEPIGPSPASVLWSVCLSAGCGFLAACAEGWWSLVAAVLQGIALLLGSILLHECAHGTCFATRRWNPLVGRLLGTFLLTPFDGYRRGHRAHHKYAGTSKDPTPNPIEPRRPNRFLDLLVRIRVVPILFWFGVHLPYLLYDFRSHAGERRLRHCFASGAGLVCGGMLYFAAALSMSTLSFLIWFLGGFVIWGILYEHLFTMHHHLGLAPIPLGKSIYRPTDQMHFARSTRLPGASRLLFFNLHKEHHLLPMLPARLLPHVQTYLKQHRPALYEFTSEAPRSSRRERAHELLTPKAGDR